MDALWTEKDDLSVRRIKYLDRGEITTILRNGPVWFVIANVGDKLQWLDIDGCYKAYKSEVAPHILVPDSRVSLDELKDGYGYWASLWSDYLGAPIILLEKVH